MTEIRYNKLDQSYEIMNIDNIVAGTKETKFIKIWIGSIIGGSFVPDLTIASDNTISVGLVYTRPDGKHTWFLPLSPQLDGSFLGSMSGWVLRISGLLSIDMHVKKLNTDVNLAYNRVNILINDGLALDDDDFVFTEADWEAMWEAINLNSAPIIVSPDEPVDTSSGLIWYEVLDE